MSTKVRLNFVLAFNDFDPDHLEGCNDRIDYEDAGPLRYGTTSRAFYGASAVSLESALEYAEKSGFAVQKMSEEELKRTETQCAPSWCRDRGRAQIGYKLSKISP